MKEKSQSLAKLMRKDVKILKRKKDGEMGFVSM
jgi:hypothetical protein